MQQPFRPRTLHLERFPRPRGQLQRRDLGAGDTAFGHRSALATVQYTATYTSGPATRAVSYVRGFRSAMTPSWGTGAYVNYADGSLKHYQSAYFDGNAGRLHDVRSTYDPHHLFTQPQDL